MNLLTQITEAIPEAKPIADSWTFRGWVLALVPVVAYAFKLDPTQFNEWLDLVWQTAALGVMLVGTARRPDIRLPAPIVAVLRRWLDGQ